MSTRVEQVAATLRRAVQDVLGRGLQDPRVQGLLSVTSVEVSSDGRDATVHVSVLPAEKASLTMHGLRHATPHIQGEVARRVALRRMPRLHFKLDERLKKEAAVHAAIAEGRRRNHERLGTGLDESQDGAPEGS